MLNKNTFHIKIKIKHVTERTINSGSEMTC